MSTEPTPSARQWCVLVTSAQRPPAIPSKHDDLPERPLAIQALGVEVSRPVEQLGRPARRRQSRAPDVVADVQQWVGFPVREPRAADGRRGEPLPEARERVEAQRQPLTHVPELRRRTAGEHEHRADVHVSRQVRLLEPEERRVEG